MKSASTQVTLAYALRLYPTANKASVLPLYVQEFQRLHKQACEELLARAWDQGHAGFPLNGLCQKGRGEFASRALYRAWQDLRRQAKACKKTRRRFQIPFLRAEMLNAAEVQTARHAGKWQYWVHLEGTSNDQVYLPANSHRALTRALSSLGAKLSKATEVYRRNGKWYARVFVTIPIPEPTKVSTYVGCDIGVRKAVCTSDGYHGPDLRPMLTHMREQQADRTRRGIEKQTVISYQRSRIAHEARRVVSVARASGRGVAIEDPKRLIRWKGHAARYFGKRVMLLGQLMGVSVVPVNPAYTSQTHARCGSRESTVRNGELLWCMGCHTLEDADVNAAKQISLMAHETTGRGAQKTPIGRVAT